jgi:hypothetical protein
MRSNREHRSKATRAVYSTTEKTGDKGQETREKSKNPLSLSFHLENPIVHGTTPFMDFQGEIVPCL